MVYAIAYATNVEAIHYVNEQKILRSHLAEYLAVYSISFNVTCRLFWKAINILLSSADSGLPMVLKRDW